MVRKPAVCGQFYPGTEAALRNTVGGLLGKGVKKENVLGILTPHAGYTYSGPVAGRVFSSINIPKTIVILGPNHTGVGVVFSLYIKDSWQTPLGEVKIDKELADLINKKSNLVDFDEQAHTYEHSLEVQLPFIQFLQKDFKIVPMVLSTLNLESYRELGCAIASSIEELKREALIIASSDMTHYESQQQAKEKDKKAIDAMLKLDEQKLLNTVEGLRITMCGYIPVCVMLAAVKQLGAKEARLVEYQTSGDVSGDYSAVVGYAGMIFK